MSVEADKVAVVIPHPGTNLKGGQEFSLQTCLRVLGRHPIFFVTKKSVSVEPLAPYLDRIQVIRVDDDRMASIESYSKLLMSREFYKLFEQFEYILVHQLDVVVFEDRLLEWCDKGYDYSGPPMFQGDEPRPSLWVAGNGGFHCGKHPRLESSGKTQISRLSFKKNVAISTVNMLRMTSVALFAFSSRSSKCK